MKNILTIVLFFISTLLVGLDHATDLEINHSAAYFLLFFMVLASLTLWMHHLFKIKEVYLLMILSTIGVFCYVCFIFRWGGEWCTQTILYQNKRNKNRTIEYQMVDVGIFGYSRRTIDRIKIIPFMDWTKEIQASEIDTSQWNEVNIFVNDIEANEI